MLLTGAESKGAESSAVYADTSACRYQETQHAHILHIM